jgi:hypothetical protein
LDWPRLSGGEMADVVTYIQLSTRNGK